jgi:hypothetical protein
MNDSPLIGLALSAGSLLGLYLAFRLLRKATELKRRAVRVPGTVIEMIATPSTNGDTQNLYLFAPRYGFRTPAGKEITVISPDSSRPPAYKVGQRVSVLYDSQTGEARLSTWMELTGGPIILALFCCAMLAVGILIMGGG